MNKNILLFDGVCNLCNRAVQFIIKRDPGGKFKFAALQSDSGKQMMERFGLIQMETDSFVLIQGDRYFIKSTAVLKVFKTLGGVWKLVYIFIIVPKPVRDFIYDIVAKSRYRIFGKKETCMVPAPGLKDRFL